MAPLPVDSTARYVVHYASGSLEHTQLFRMGTPISPSAFGVFADALWTAIGGSLRQATINEVIFYPNGSTIGSPVAVTGFVGNTYGSGTPTNSQQSFELNFVARSTGGRRVRLGFFSPDVADETWRFNPGENVDVDAAIDVLEAQSDLVGIDGNPLIWKQYGNVLYNAYWIRHTRS